MAEPIFSLKDFDNALIPRQPVDIITFATNKEYLGERLYPRDTLILKLFYKITLSIAEQTDVEKLIGEGRLPYDILERNQFAELVLVVGRRGGKGLWEEEPILTPDGYSAIKNINVGDTVFDRNGEPTKVTHKFVRGVQPCYKFTFTDGKELIVDEDHLWVMIDPHRRGEKVLTTKDLVTNKRYYFENKNNTSGSIPATKPIKFSEKGYYIHPYVLGALLGDGCLLKAITFSNNDQDIIKRVESLLPEDYKLNKAIGENYDYRIARERNGGKPSPLLEEVDRLGLRYTYSDTKFVPHEYKIGSIEQRLEILRGLLDTDGYVVKNHRLSFSSASKQLAEDVVYLVESLGGKAWVSSKIPTFTYKGEKKQGKKSYTVCFILKEFNPFYCSRKAKEYFIHKQTENKHLKNIEYVGEMPSICIAVDSPTKTFIAKNQIVTHNTFLASIVACYELYKLLLKDNPQAFYGISEKDPIYVVNCAVSGAQARTPMFEYITSKILACKWFEDKILKPGDMEIKFQTSSDKRKEKEIEILYGVKKSVSTVRAMALHTKSASTRGKNIICCIFDELAHFDETGGPGSADKMYEALKPSIKTFGDDGKIINISSPLTQSGKFYELYLRSYARTPTGEELPKEVSNEMCVVQMPTWEINPTITKESLIEEEKANPENFWMEYGAEFGMTMNRFLDPEIVDKIFTDEVKELQKGVMQYRYEIHCDPAKSDAGMAIAVARRVGTNAYLEHLKVFRAEDFPPDEEGKQIIDYKTVEDYLYNLCVVFPTKTLSFDQWNSIGSIQRLRTRLRKDGVYTRVIEDTFTDKSNYDRYDNLKRCINRGFVKTFKPDGRNYAGLLSNELKHLQEKDGRKVIKQERGTCTTKDLADCVAVVVQRLLKEPEPDQRTRRSMPKTTVAAGRV